MWQKTIGIVGTGAIGRAVAHRARGFDMKILGYDVAPDTEFAREIGLTYMSLESLLAESDIVTVHVPLLSATKGLLGVQELASMKKGAFLFNLARGPL